nr:MAG TPA: hypothetical protein [Caudoviricetes sp.]
MFVFEFENPLFEFASATPHREPLLALPPTCSSSTIYYLFFAHSVVAENLRTEWADFLFSVIHEILLKEISTLRFQSFVYFSINTYLSNYFRGACRLM